MEGGGGGSVCMFFLSSCQFENGATKKGSKIMLFKELCLACVCNETSS